MSSRIVAACIGLVAILSLSACANTIRGAGRDVGNTVKGTQDAVEDVARS